jgi:hypothetical protein
MNKKKKSPSLYHATKLLEDPEGERGREKKSNNGKNWKEGKGTGNIRKNM